MVKTLQDYLAHIQEQLPFGGSRRARILSEIETHLLESWEDEQRHGIPVEEALALVLERFGSPVLVGRQFARLEMERRLWQGKQCWQRAGGGVLGRISTRKMPALSARWNAALVTPLICMGLLLIIFIVEVLWNLW